MREKTIRHILVGVLFAWLFLFFTLLAPARAYTAGTRVFDQVNLFSAAGKQELERRIATKRERMKLDLVIVATNQAGGKSVEAYTNDFYDQGGYGHGARESGILYLIDMNNRRIHVSTAGGDIQLLSDSEIEKLLDLGAPGVKSGNCAEGASRMLSGTQNSYRRAQRKGWTYNAENGIWTKKKHLSPLTALGSLAASLVAALGAMTGVKRSYKIQGEEARRALTVANIIAASGVAFDFGELSDRLLDRNHVGRRMRRSNDGSGDGRNSGPHGSSSTRTSSGGSSHGGGGRSF